MIVKGPAGLKSSERSVAVSRRTAQQGAASLDAAAATSGPAPRGRRRGHVLHGWRRLLGPLIVQVLNSSYEVMPVVPASLVTRLYRSHTADPRPTRNEIA